MVRVRVLLVGLGLAATAGCMNVGMCERPPLLGRLLARTARVPVIVTDAGGPCGPTAGTLPLDAGPIIAAPEGLPLAPPPDLPLTSPDGTPVPSDSEMVPAPKLVTPPMSKQMPYVPEDR
jgi:hypothetical protein